MTDLVDAPAGDFEWGPQRRFDTIRERVSKTTLRDRLPEIAMAVGAAILVCGTVLLWLSSGSSNAVGAPREPPPAAVVQPAAAPFPTAEPEPLVIVHVSGLVSQPGIVEIPISARVFHAVEAAGGSLENGDLDSINLAAPIVDGSQIHVPAMPAPETVETLPGDTTSAGLESPGQPPTNNTLPEADASAGSATSVPPQTTAPSVRAPHPRTPDQATFDLAPETLVDPWGAEEPGPIPTEVEALMFDRETAPTADEIDALLAEAGLSETDS